MLVSASETDGNSWFSRGVRPYSSFLFRCFSEAFIPSPSNPFPPEPDPMRPAFRLLIVTLTVALCTTAVGLVRQAIAWDSIKGNPTHPTHSYLTEWAVDQLKAAFPEVQAFRVQLIDGANQELHELETSGSLYGVDLEAKREQHKGTNEGCDDIQGWWDDARNAYRGGTRKRPTSCSASCSTW